MFAIVLLAGCALALSLLYLHLRAPALVLRSTGARRIHFEEAPRLHRIAAHLSVRARIPLPTLFVIRSSRADAFSVGRGRSGSVVVTTGALEQLPRAELEALIALKIARLALGHSQRTTPLALLPSARPNSMLARIYERLHRLAHPEEHRDAARRMAVRLLEEASVLRKMMDGPSAQQGDDLVLADDEVAAANASTFRSAATGVAANREWKRRVATVKRIAAEREARKIVHRTRGRLHLLAS